MQLLVQNVTVTIGAKTLVDNASFSLGGGELVALLGPNGAGKTTLLRAALGFAKTTLGQVALDGADITALSPIARARRMAYLPQIRPLAWPNRVRDIVALGRYSHGGALGKLGKDDAKSGGELARVHCARAFAAGAPLLIADEPVAALDPRHQHRVMTLVKEYVANEEGNSTRGALVVLHDIALAAKYADRLIWMKDGLIVADGTPQDTLTTTRLAEVYGVSARVEKDDICIDGYL